MKSLIFGKSSRILRPLCRILLHYEIQSAYGWDNDHMFSFLMDNKFWNSNEEYSADPMGNGSAGSKALKDLNLKKDFVFGYLFDFGDNHQFKVTVLDILKSEEEQAKYSKGFIKSVGTPPEQYEFEKNNYVFTS